MKTINRAELEVVINNIHHGRFFSLVFARAEPKCLSCNKKSKKWLLERPAVCPHCGGLVSYEREALAQTGVHNPSNTAIAPKGTGECFASRRHRGIFGFYDSQIKSYRECHVDNIRKLKLEGEEYVVMP
ncbi:MAG: hypothetical protein EOM83_15725 [Clostridia bacterium]|nr:hypothetical protein [Clostridia bacterium]